MGVLKSKGIRIGEKLVDVYEYILEMKCMDVKNIEGEWKKTSWQEASFLE